MSSAIVEAENVPQATGLAIASEQSGVMALAFMSEADFEVRLTALKQGQERVRRVQRELMVAGEDFGIIPGTVKHTLLKPGAEKLCNFYGLRSDFDPVVHLGDGVTAPHIRVEMRCVLHQGDIRGPIVGVGHGAANSWERRYRYRTGKRACPECGATSINRSKFEKDGDKGYYCYAAKGGCGAEFASNDVRITEQVAGEVENPDPFDIENTLVKIAEKRAHVDATLRATATSGLFTQDLEESPDEPGDTQSAPPMAAPARAPAPSTQSRPPAPPPTSTSKPAAAGDRWNDPCPKCGKRLAVITNRYDGGWVCWPKSTREKGCGYKWTAEDAAIHKDAARVRHASGEVDDDPSQLTDEEKAQYGLDE